MPIRFTPLVNDIYYHIFNRGVNKQDIFNGAYDYKRAINLLHYYNIIDVPLRYSKFQQLTFDQKKGFWDKLDSLTPHHTDIVSYCFMPNHYHLLVKQNSVSGIKKLVADFQNSYAKYFNIKYSRVGPLFQGRFKALHINSEEQLLHLSRYIHLNPSSSNLIKATQLEKYKWSSFNEYLGKSNFDFCSKDVILNRFKDVNEYKIFVFNNADYQRELKHIEHLTYED